MLKRVANYGELSRPAKTAGWSLLILAAGCLLIGGFVVFRGTSRMGQLLEQQSASQDEIHRAVGEVFRTVGGGEWLFFTAVALVILSIGCFLFGRRTPPAPK